MTSWDDLDLGDEEAVFRWLCDVRPATGSVAHVGAARLIARAYRRGRDIERQAAAMLVGELGAELAELKHSPPSPDYGEPREGWWPERPGWYLVRWADERPIRAYLRGTVTPCHFRENQLGPGQEGPAIFADTDMGIYSEGCRFGMAAIPPNPIRLPEGR